MSLKINHLPEFETVLPLTQKKIKFRPFVMKEEKLLLLAAESQDKNDVLMALDTVIKGCTFEKISIETLPMVDVQHLFLQIRGKSVGEEIDFNLLCGQCSYSLPSKININEIKIKYTDNHNKIIDIGNNTKVTMEYPKINHLALLFDDQSSIDDVYNVVADCIEKIESNDEVFTKENISTVEAKEFVDNMTSAQFKKIKEFFDTMPIIEHDISFQCPKCNTENSISMDEIVNFFV